MPHYADGSECKVGDHVVGVLANQDGKPKAGTVISVTPDSEACNARVRFTQADFAPIGVDQMPLRPRMAVGNPELTYGANHNTSGYVVTLHTCEDYADTKNLMKVG